MLKKSSYKRIIIASLALIILALLYFFPNDEEININENLSYNEPSTDYIYLLDTNHYVARTNIINNNKDIENRLKNTVESLIINGKNSDYIPEGFSPLISKDTKLLNLSIDKNLVKVDFSKEFLNTEDLNKAIEALIYSLTEYDNIDSIMIFVEGKQLIKDPNKNSNYPQVFTRDFGINKIYDISSLKNTSIVTTYYISQYNDNYYYVPISKITNNEKEKIEVIIDELKSSPITETNLISFLNANAELKNYEILSDSISLSFNNLLFNDLDNKTILEEVKYAIGLSVKDTYNIKDVFFYVDDELIDSLN